MTCSSASRFVLLVLAMLLLDARPARAAESYDNCSGFITSIPTTISTQGTWCLKQDLATAITSGSAITINANNVTIDCNNFKLGGLAAGAGTTAYGIYAVDRANETVRHCNVRGFYVGVDFEFSSGSSSGHTVEDNRLDGNTAIGIRVVGDGSVIQRNRVFDTGLSTAQISATGIVGSDSVDILDNTVSGVSARTGGNGDATGIATVTNNDGTISGNRIRTVVKDGTGVAYGIYNSFSGRVNVHNNDLVGPGALAIHCLTSDGSYGNNIISGFTAATDNCTDGGGNAIVP